MDNKSQNISALLEKSVLASPPDLLFKIINSLDSELSSKQIGDIIGHDQSISAQVLKLSNSSFFGFKGNIKTLDRAINILGTKTVRNIAVTTLLFAHTNKVRLWNIDIMAFWLHAFLTAEITRELSQKVGLDGDESYIAGLLHDIGKLILYAQRQEKSDLFTKPHSSDDLYDYERKLWGIDSTELSRMLLMKWNIPEDTVTAVAEHTSPRGGSLLSKVVFLANEFSAIATDFYYTSSISYPVFTRLLRDFDMKEEDFNRFATHVPSIVERGKLIMKVMSKTQSSSQQTGVIKRRLITKSTLVSPNEFSFSKCLLELLGFSVDLFTPAQIQTFLDSQRADEALRRREYSQGKTPEEEDAEDARKAAAAAEKEKEKLKSTGFFTRLFSKKKVEVQPVEEILEEETKTKIINWNPLVVFELCDPIEIEKPGVTVYQVMRDPSQLKGTSIPFFFSNPNIKTK